MIWRKLIRPVFWLLGLYVAFQFLYQIFTENGSERFVILILTGFATLIVIAQLFQKLIEYRFIKRVQKLALYKVIKKVLNYLTPIVLLVAIYVSWQRDWVGTLFIMTIMLLMSIIDLFTGNHES